MSEPSSRPRMSNSEPRSSHAGLPTAHAQPGSASRIAVALPAGSSDLQGTYELLRDRIGLWARWVFILSSGFYLVNIITWPLVQMHGMSLAEVLLQPSTLLH